MLFVTPWTAALQASLSFTISQSLLKFNTPGYRPEKPAGTTHSSRSDLSPREQLERQAEFQSSTQDEA